MRNERRRRGKGQKNKHQRDAYTEATVCCGQRPHVCIVALHANDKALASLASVFEFAIFEQILNESIRPSFATRKRKFCEANRPISPPAPRTPNTNNHYPMNGRMLIAE